MSHMEFEEAMDSPTRPVSSASLMRTSPLATWRGCFSSLLTAELHHCHPSSVSTRGRISVDSAVSGSLLTSLIMMVAHSLGLLGTLCSASS